MRKGWIITVSLAASLGLTAGAQELPPNVPTKEQLARNNKLFIELATKYLKWDEPAEPIRIVGPLYFVGTQGLSSWLFATGEGHILLNTGTPKSGPMIAGSIRKLGFKPEDVRDHHQRPRPFRPRGCVRLPEAVVRRAADDYARRRRNDRGRGQERLPLWQ